MPGDFRLGVWWVRPSQNTIQCSGRTVRLEPKVVEVLVCLAEHAGETVSKEKLIGAVWRDTFVTDDVLTRCVSELRKALEDDPKEPRVIETIPRKGYRLLERVEPIPLPGPVPPPKKNWKWVAGSALIIVATVLVTVLWHMVHPNVMLPDIRQTQLTTNSSENPLGSAAISPDGRYLAYADLTGIHIKSIETRDVQNIAQPESLKDVPVDWTVGPWFKDGARFLAVANFPSPRGPNFNPSTWTVSSLGGVPHLLRRTPPPGRSRRMAVLSRLQPPRTGFTDRHPILSRVIARFG